MSSVTVSELFKRFADIGISVYTAGRSSLVYEPLSPEEQLAVRKVFRTGLTQLEDISPKIASKIRPQEDLAVTIAGVFKAMLPEKKTYTFPSRVGGLGAVWLFPQAVRWAATPSGADPCYTSYSTNSWNIPVTAGMAAYFFGSSANFYRSNPNTGRHSVNLVFQDGVVEIGSTPRIDQYRIVAQGEEKYGIYTVVPVVEVPIEENKVLYLHRTPMGAVPITYDLGIRWSFMPNASGTSTIKLLGMVFYEHDFAPDLAWVA